LIDVAIVLGMCYTAPAVSHIYWIKTQARSATQNSLWNLKVSDEKAIKQKSPSPFKGTRGF